MASLETESETLAKMDIETHSNPEKEETLHDQVDPEIISNNQEENGDRQEEYPNNQQEEYLNSQQEENGDSKDNEQMDDKNFIINEESKDSDYSNSTTETDSSMGGSRRNVAKRGRKRKHSDISENASQRATPRRSAARNVKCYADDDDGLNDIDADDPDYQFSDSDDDPDFDPIQRRTSPGSPEMDSKHRTRRGKAKGKGRSSASRSRLFENKNDGFQEISSTINDEKKRSGRPSSYLTPTQVTAEVSDNTVSSTDDSKLSGKLSSAYNYAAARSRQNQAIRLPEGPNLSDEQLKLIESQFKSGDFVMAKKDIDMMEHPPIWRIDGKSLLQKFQSFDKDGKTLYRNISTYSGWTAQAKALYVPVKVNFVFQSRYDTVVELVGFKGATSKEVLSQVIDKPILTKNKDIEISEDLRQHMGSFEIYLQTLISQALDNNFLHEIYEENDSYFIDKVKVIDDLTGQRKTKILDLVTWNQKFQTSLNIWPCINTMTAKISGNCQACDADMATMLSQFYGQPYDEKALRSKEPSLSDLENKNFETCDQCSTLSQLYNKVAHQKYDYYSQCKSTVTNMRVSFPSKTTTTVLRDLLANDEWINGLFRSMCVTWMKIDRHYNEKKGIIETDENNASADAEGNSNSNLEKSTDDTNTDDAALSINNAAESKEPNDAVQNTNSNDIDLGARPSEKPVDTVT